MKIKIINQYVTQPCRIMVWAIVTLMLVMTSAVDAQVHRTPTSLPGWSSGGGPAADQFTSPTRKTSPTELNNDTRRQLGLAESPVPHQVEAGASNGTAQSPGFNQPVVRRQSRQRLGPLYQDGPSQGIAQGPTRGTRIPTEPDQSFVGQATYDAADTVDVRQDSMSDKDAQSGLQATADLEELSQLLTNQGESLTSREGLGSSIKVGLLLAVLSLAPAIVLMTTCYVRVVVVLTLLRQAFGSQQLPPTQVLTALSLFLTLLVMAPVWNTVKTEAIDPYTAEENPISWEEAWQRGTTPIKKFMANQITASGNTQSVAMFYKYLPPEQRGGDLASEGTYQSDGEVQRDEWAAEAVGDGSASEMSLPESIDDVPINVLLPAFLVSELKVAFLLGFQIYLPFLVLDLVVSSVTVSTGMLMLPPTMVSFPLKLILFVMVDGWNLVVGMLLQSFAPYT